jgi:hypothetical protein
MKRLAVFAFAALFGASLAPALAQTGSSSAAMPSCSSGDPVVWENTAGSKHVYHVSGDKYYGTTKHGKYVCESQAKSDGYHAAKMKGGMMGGSSSSGSMSASPAPQASGGGMMGMGHHHKKHHGMGMDSASPAPSPTAT